MKTALYIETDGEWNDLICALIWIIVRWCCANFLTSLSRLLPWICNGKKCLNQTEIITLGSQWWDARADLGTQRLIKFNVGLLTAVLFVEEDIMHAVSVGPSLVRIFSVLVFRFFLSLSSSPSIRSSICKSMSVSLSLWLPIRPPVHLAAHIRQL